MPKKPVSPFMQKVLTLLMPHGDIRARSMFGGHGIYLDGMMFALIACDRLFFKTDAETRPRFVRTRSKPFSFMRAGKEMVTSYYEVPPRTMNSARAIMPWVELANIAARSVANAKKAKAPAKKAGGAKVARRLAKRVVKSPHK